MIALCQRPGASCGACCGLYNRQDLSRAAARADLWKNTELFVATERTPAAFRAAAARRARELPQPLFPSVRICPLLGYLDGGEARVGCLGHPKVTGGPDLRACGVYDVLTCDAFLCPSHAYLGEDDAELAAGAADDFYLYGLVVTDAPFLRAVTNGLAAATGLRPVPGDLRHPHFRRALHAVLALKEELEPGSEGLFGAFHAAAGRKEPPPAEVAASPAARVLEALGADPLSGNDGDGLEGEVRRRVEACAAALRQARGVGR